MYRFDPGVENTQFGFDADIACCPNAVKLLKCMSGLVDTLLSL